MYWDLIELGHCWSLYFAMPSQNVYSFYCNCESHFLILKLTCATLMPVQKLMFPRGCTACSLDSILPVSGVSVVSTSQLLHRYITLRVIRWTYLKCQYTNTKHTAASYFAMVMRPTLFSGLLRVLEWQTILTASCWACSLVGRKSPLRMYSLLSTLRKKEQPC